MLDKAIAFYKSNGPKKAFAAFNNPKGQFVDKDLYIFAVDLNGKILAHGAIAGLLGLNKPIPQTDLHPFDSFSRNSSTSSYFVSHIRRCKRYARLILFLLFGRI